MGISRAAQLATLIAVLAWPAAGQAPTEQAEFTFASPTRVPGALLPPGTYRFIAERHGDGYAVQIAGNGADVRAIAVPVARTEAKGEVYRVFQSRGTEQPPALRAWFRPGSLQGFLLAYPSEQARALAAGSGMFALSAPASAGGQPIEFGSLRVVTPDGAQAPLTAVFLRGWDAPPLPISPVK
jgi:hypothetical protein